MKYDKRELSERLDRIDKITFYKLNNIKIGSSLSDLGSVKDDKISYKGLIKKYLLNIFEYSYKLEVFGGGKILFFYSNENRNRQYVYQKMQNVENLSKSKTVIKPHKRKIHFDGFLGFLYIFKWFSQLRKQDFTKKESLYFSLCIHNAYINLFDVLEIIGEKIGSINLFVSVHDNRMVDSVAIQYFRNMGIDTCTLQHGELLIDDIWLDAGKSFSKYFCIYGDLTYSRIKNSMNHNNEIVKLGMPQMIGIKHMIRHHENKGIFGVYLNYIAFEEENVPMIALANQIAEKYNLKYFIKYHPSLKNKDYRNKCSNKCYKEYRDEVNANDLSEIIDFAIVSMSSMFGELLYQGIPTFRYVNSEIDMYQGVEMLKITTLEDVEKYLDRRNDILYDEMEKTVEIICGAIDPKEAYTCFLERFES